MLTWLLWNALKKPFMRRPVFYRAIQLRKAGVGEVSFFTRPIRRLTERLQRFAARGVLARCRAFLID